ncbi:MAG: hypothetical protein L6R39_007455 [Caloplaca ligustica]|nr:MAG: hypothetical protein L6R39_007455 [Caloplaca ligustica]
MSSKTIAPVQGNESESIWKLEADDAAYWDLYLATRPQYTLSFFEEMYAYHAAHCSSFETAIDVGTGCGQAVPKLAHRFSHVVASDNSPDHIAEARRRLAPLLPEHDRVTFTVCPAEDLASRYSPASIDFIAVAECMPLLDIDTAIDGFARLLRPGATLAIWFYGRPHFAEPAFTQTCQPLLDRILDSSFRKVVSGRNPEQRAAWQRVMRGMNSWLDDVALPEAQWDHVQRRKWNEHAYLPFFGPDACDFEVERTSRVGGWEEMHHHLKDESFWEVRWDFATLNDFVAASFPGMKALQDDDRDIQRLLDELRIQMGVGVRKFAWPVVQILASRKFDA